MRRKEPIIRNIVNSQLMEALPNFKSGISSLFTPADRSKFVNYMRGNIADDWRRDWQIIGNDIKTVMGNYKVIKVDGHRK